MSPNATEPKANSSSTSLIKEARARSNKAIATNDIPGILAELDSSFHITGSNGQLLSSRDAMGKAFAGQFKSHPDTIYIRTIENIEISSSDDMAYESGTWCGHWTTKQGPVETGGNYSASWSKTSGAWKIRAELFVTLY